jgi:hypothetical protein
MPKMSTSDLKAMLSAEKSDALAAVSAAELAFEPDRLMGYCVTIYFAKLLIFDKVLGLGTTDGLAGFASTTANLIVASYFAKRGFENVARIIKR